MKEKKMKREEAELRKNEYSVLSAKEKLDLLDGKLGKGVGAKKQRARLNRELVKEAK